MLRIKNEKWRILFICTVCFIAAIMLSACGHFKEMTPAKKHATIRTAFNEMVKSYIAQAKLQPEDVRAKLREEVNPVIKDAEEALDKYYESLTLPNDDPDARLAFYLDLKNQMLELCLKYGLKIEEGGAM
jgi:hypothetical protein